MRRNLKKLDEIILYTDGCSFGNPGPGGYGAVLLFGEHRKEISGGFRLTTNNRMEIMSVIYGLKQLKRKCRVTVYSDSQYLVNSMTKGWIFNWKARGWVKSNKEAVLNVDLWLALLEEYNKHEVDFIWIRGHAGIKENERCDYLAKQAASQENLLIDRGYENLEPKSLL